MIDGDVVSSDVYNHINTFKNIILSAYGKKSDDGRHFTKNQQLREEFESSEAYSSLFIELVTNTDAAIEFINGVIPSGMAEEVAKVAAMDLAPVEEVVVPIITKEDLVKATPEELQDIQNRVISGEAKLEG